MYEGSDALSLAKIVIHCRSHSWFDLFLRAAVQYCTGARRALLVVLLVVLVVHCTGMHMLNAMHPHAPTQPHYIITQQPLAVAVAGRVVFVAPSGAAP